MTANAMFTRCDRFHSVVTAGCYSLSVFHLSLTRRDRKGWCTSELNLKANCMITRSDRSHSVVTAGYHSLSSVQEYLDLLAEFRLPPLPDPMRKDGVQSQNG
jgi:hypothetical protein